MNIPKTTAYTRQNAFRTKLTRETIKYTKRVRRRCNTTSEVETRKAVCAKQNISDAEFVKLSVYRYSVWGPPDSAAEIMSRALETSQSSKRVKTWSKSSLNTRASTTSRQYHNDTKTKRIRYYISRAVYIDTRENTRLEIDWRVYSVTAREWLALFCECRPQFTEGNLDSVVSRVPYIRTDLPTISVDFRTWRLGLCLGSFRHLAFPPRFQARSLERPVRACVCAQARPWRGDATLHALRPF